MTSTACSACGRAFGCGVDAGDCWCTGVETDATTLEAMAGAYTGCLCPDCLRAEAAAAATRYEPPAGPSPHSSLSSP